jgi:hypothetical protein
MMHGTYSFKTRFLQGQAFLGEFLTLPSFEMSRKFWPNDKPSRLTKHEYPT